MITDPGGPMTSTTTTKRKPAARRKAAAADVVDAQAVDQLDDLDELDDDPIAEADTPTLAGVVVRPDLVFTTPAKNRTREPEAERALPFTIDGAVYTIIRPNKLEETIAGLIESGARRATEADVLFAGMTFLRKVLARESLTRLQARLDDDDDDFEIGDLFDTLERIAVALVRSAPASTGRGPVPARRRAANR